jgi:hypothetical protein
MGSQGETIYLLNLVEVHPQLNHISHLVDGALMGC